MLNSQIGRNQIQDKLRTAEKERFAASVLGETSQKL